MGLQGKLESVLLLFPVLSFFPPGEEDAMARAATAIL